VFIIIEGADKTGKTTLANAIVERFGCKYMHSGKPGKSPATEYATYALKNHGSIVCDRFHLGELVYGPLFRGKAGISPLEFATLERILRLKQTILIQTTTDISLANKRLLVSTQNEMVDQTQNAKAVVAFNKIINQSNVQHIIKYDGSTRQNLNDVLDQIESLKDLVEKDQAVIRKVCTGIGTPTGKKIVFVGEKVNKRVSWLDLPFDKGFSSQFLLDSFKAAGVPETLVYLCNADKLKKAEVDFLRNDSTVFVALGKKAQAKLKELNVLHFALPHPQFVKRFHWKNKDEYAYRLQSILVANNDIL
jgi:thymidylate kinase